MRGRARHFIHQIADVFGILKIGWENARLFRLGN